ncbi:DUF3971 domain-containing protein [Roseomonas sp. CECT 9278]|uniref:DUF3971 domain-containing protein n=1 Tax=Roseomonas sp. CECT 9278 TaxID=2845823 RepID=UPI001E29979D|nr:DUF3971 domain-containing protein [Roseomonas sp. CECT 9278]CAH0283314.1 hypothetical protein ROS9278_04006 [Roseomonas sp. CECT 9278]
MRRAAGQAGRSLNRLLRGCSAVVMLAAVGLTAVAWRLGQGPVEVPWLARQAEASFNTADAPARLSIGEATIAWAGWREGHASPLEFTLRRVRAIDRDGAVRAELPDAAVSLSPDWLLRGRVAPRVLEMRGLSLRAVRAADGAFSLGLGLVPQDGDAAAAPSGAEEAVLALLGELMQPPSDATPLAALRRLRLVDTRLVVADAQLDRTWSIEFAALSLTRRERGGLDLGGTGAASIGPEQVPLRLAGMIEGATRDGQVTLSLPAIRPAALARAAPLLRPLAALDAPAAIALDVRIEGLRLPSRAQARLRVGPGAIDLGAGGRLAVAAIEADLALDGAALRVEHALLRPAPARPGAPGPVIEAQAEARLDGDAWTGEARLRLDAVELADLPHYWPAGLARGARGWLAENLTEGIARDGAWRVGFAGDVATGAVRVTAVEGSAEAEDVTVHWLRPIPPAEDARGRARFALDAITIEIAGGRQAGGGIVVREGSVRIGLDSDPETADIALVAAGPLADVWALLRHPRLRLFDRRPPPITAITGTLREGRVQVSLPLFASVPVEAVRVSASGRGTEVRVPRAILGRDIERGSFDFTADTEGLRVNGTATLAGIQLRLTQEADFRPGPPGQVVSRETATGRADAAQIAGLGLDPRPFVEGPVGLDIRGETRRNGQGRIQLRADLTAARLSVEPLAWAKAPGLRATGEATINMLNGSLAAVEAIRVEAPDALLRGRAINPRDNIPQRIEIQQGNLGRNRFTAEIAPPRSRADSWTVGLRGPVLDLVPVLAAPHGPLPGAQAPSGPGTAVEARFDRMLLADDRALTGVSASARVDGHGVIMAAEVRGGVAGGGPFDMRITPQGAQRRVRIGSSDGGALLRAFGVLRTIQGGRLAVDATYANARPNAPLTGSATLEEFAVRDAPALAKLLQAMTVFGVFEALDQRGLSFASLTAPFVLTREALVLNDARAFSVSLGVTARGRIDRQRDTIDMEGTIVPAYVFNSLLGRIPVLGRIFSPEQGGGLFAATYRMRGPMADPGVSVNPLAALTPGFLRGIFGIGQDAAGTVPDPAPAR